MMASLNHLYFLPSFVFIFFNIIFERTFIFLRKRLVVPHCWNSSESLWWWQHSYNQIPLTRFDWTIVGLWHELWTVIWLVSFSSKIVVTDISLVSSIFLQKSYTRADMIFVKTCPSSRAKYRLCAQGMGRFQSSPKLWTLSPVIYCFTFTFTSY